MYLSHFGFKEKPFDINPDPEMLYFSDQHRFAISMLEYGLFEQSGITVLTGDIGTGKTTLIRHLVRRIPYDKIALGIVNNVHRSYGNILQWIASAYDINAAEVSNVKLLRLVQEYFVSEYAAGRKVVLILDEAQNMTREDFEELRMLSNINSDKNHMFQPALVGQPQLLASLYDQGMEQLLQRVTAEVHLNPLSRQDVEAYINHRTKLVGVDREIFSADAIAAIFRYSDGVPRLINAIADQSLVNAMGEGLTSVDQGMVDNTIVARRKQEKGKSCENSDRLA